jgi:predicted transport protein
MDKATQTMIDNLHKTTGKTLEEWITIAKKQNIAKHGEMLAFLKDNHGLSYGYANLVAHKAKGSDAGSAENQDELIENQYKGKEHFKPIYDKLMADIQRFGKDIEIAPKNAYVSLRRKKQFAILQPATKTRFEIGINLKGQEPKGKLEAVPQANAMCSHKINLASLADIDKEVINWIKQAYDHAG